MDKSPLSSWAGESFGESDPKYLVDVLEAIHLVLKGQEIWAQVAQEEGLGNQPKGTEAIHAFNNLQAKSHLVHEWQQPGCYVYSLIVSWNYQFCTFKSLKRLFHFLGYHFISFLPGKLLFILQVSVASSLLQPLFSLWLNCQLFGGETMSS